MKLEDAVAIWKELAERYWFKLDGWTLAFDNAKRLQPLRRQGDVADREVTKGHTMIKGQTVYVLIIEGQYPGNNSTPEVFADKADADARKTELEAIREGVEGHWSHQVHWCYVEEMAIR